MPNGILIQAVVLNYNRSREVNFKQRVELPTAKPFEGFKKALEHRIRTMKEQRIGSVKELKIEIADINNGYYGVNILGKAKPEELEDVKESLREASLAAINGLK